MRSARRLVAVVFLLMVTPFLMGATCTLTKVTPNPGGTGSRLKGEGKYTVAQGEKALVIYFSTMEKGTKQLTQNSATAANGDWDCTLKVVPATYNPTSARMYYEDAKKMIQITPFAEDKNDQVVK